MFENNETLESPVLWDDGVVSGAISGDEMDFTVEFSEPFGSPPAVVFSLELPDISERAPSCYLVEVSREGFRCRFERAAHPVGVLQFRLHWHADPQR